MKPVSPARRRADAFSALVEDPSAAELRDAGPYADLVDLVAGLRAEPAPEARADFVSDLRSRLMLAAETALVPDTAAQVEARRRPTPRRTGRERRLAVAIGGFAIVSATASMSVAAQTALPGDTLYPLKRAIEDVHENVLRDADSKGTTMLDNASGRLDEVDELSRSGRRDPQVIADTLQDFSDQAVEASDVLLGDYEKTGRQAAIDELTTFTTSSLEALDRLEALVPAEVRGSLLDATRILDTIEQQIMTACPACSTLDAAVGAVAADALGPLYDELIETATAPEPAPTRQPPKPRPTPTKTPPTTSGQPAPVEQPSATPAPGPVETEQPPILPQPPTGAGNGNGNGNGAGNGNGPAGTDNPLAPVVTDLGDPLGDLLTGTTQALEGLLGGGKTGLTP